MASKTKTKKSEILKEIIRLRTAQEQMYDFMRLTIPNFVDGAHIQRMCDSLERVENGECKRLIITMPPRHGKTETASVHFPAWALGRDPQRQFIACSYSADLAGSNSEATRRLIQSTQYQRLWPCELEKDTARKWQLTGKHNNRANYIAAGVGGGITGEGADILIIDDPVKNMEEANSQTYRDKVWDWYLTTAYTRLHPGGAVIIIMTRWHHDDLVGRLLRVADENPDADQWEVLHLKAIDDDANPLWPERYPLTILEQIRESVGTRTFSALYQGNPSTDEGNIVKREWWQFYDRDDIPEGVMVQSWDTAYKTGEENDYSAGFQVIKAEKGYYIHPDRIHGKWEYPQMRRLAQSFYEQHKPSLVLMEDKASGQSIIQDIRQNTVIPIKPIRVDKDKTSRLESITALIEGGRVFLPSETEWVMGMIEEFAAFPSGEHDDQVDALVQALIYFTQTSSADVLLPAGTTEGLFSKGISPPQRRSLSWT